MQLQLYFSAIGRKQFQLISRLATGILRPTKDNFIPADQIKQISGQTKCTFIPADQIKQDQIFSLIQSIIKSIAIKDGSGLHNKCNPTPAVATQSRAPRKSTQELSSVLSNRWDHHLPRLRFK